MAILRGLAIGLLVGLTTSHLGKQYELSLATQIAIILVADLVLVSLVEYIVHA